MKIPFLVILISFSFMNSLIAASKDSKKSMKQIITITKKLSVELADGLKISLDDYNTEVTAPDPAHPSEMPQSGVNVSLTLKLREKSEKIFLYQGSGPNRYSPTVAWGEYQLSIVELKNLNTNLEAKIQIEK